MSAEPAAPVLSVRDLHIRFSRHGSEITAVEGFSLDLAAGEIVALVGESGCGKSLTGASLLGMVPDPDGTCSAESLRIGPVDAAALDERGWRKLRGRQISMIFQDPLTALDPVLSIGSQLVAVIRRHQHCSRVAARATAIEWVRSAGIADAEATLARFPHELSGGMRQRVMIAMAMSARPLVMVADEPTTSLDATTQGRILEQIRDLAHSTGMAVLLITHDLSVVAQVCDRALVMYCGRVVEEAAVADLFSRPQHPYTAGLLAAVPRLAEPVQPVMGIPGTVPPLGGMPPGCRFHPRCGFADTTCRTTAPALTPAYAPTGSPAASRLACHYPLGQGAGG